MEEIKKCYRLYTNLNKIDIGTAIDKLCNIGDVVLFDGSIYIWLNNDINKLNLDNVIRKSLHIKEYYCEQIERSMIIQNNNFITSWFSEHYNNYVVAKLEAEKQEALQQMRANIQKANALLDERIALAQKPAQEISVDEKNIT